MLEPTEKRKLLGICYKNTQREYSKYFDYLPLNELLFIQDTSKMYNYNIHIILELWENNTAKRNGSKEFLTSNYFELYI
jgi:hypothetical protein